MQHAHHLEAFAIADWRGGVVWPRVASEGKYVTRQQPRNDADKASFSHYPCLLLWCYCELHAPTQYPSSVQPRRPLDLLSRSVQSSVKGTAAQRRQLSRRCERRHHSRLRGLNAEDSSPKVDRPQNIDIVEHKTRNFFQMDSFREHP